MKKKERELFEKREAFYYLIEDNELALIELYTKLKMQINLPCLVGNFEGVTGDSNLSRFIDYLYEELHKKSLIEMEIHRERSNRSYLRSRCKMLWQI